MKWSAALMLPRRGETPPLFISNPLAPVGPLWFKVFVGPKNPGRWPWGSTDEGCACVLDWTAIKNGCLIYILDVEGQNGSPTARTHTHAHTHKHAPSPCGCMEKKCSFRWVSRLTIESVGQWALEWVSDSVCSWVCVNVIMWAAAVPCNKRQ